MPTLAEGIYIKPKSWSEFESMCKDAFELKLNVTNLVMHGRSGQTQKGVDIYGDVPGIGYFGIQCKNTIGGISESLIQEECNKAENFEPSLKMFYIATTADRDVKIQGFVRELSQNRKANNQCPVEIMFWDDLIQELAKSDEIIKKHYPQLSNRPKNRDVKLLEEYCTIFNYDYQERLRHEPFGKRVKNNLIDITREFYWSTKGNPDWHFNDSILEKHRIELLESIAKFQKHFSEQSAGNPDYYDFVDLHKCLELGEKVYERNLDYVNKMQELSFDLANKMNVFLNERKLRGL